MTKLQFGLQIYSVRDHCQNKEDMLACLNGTGGRLYLLGAKPGVAELAAGAREAGLEF